jgi:CspA family cold shock protein
LSEKCGLIKFYSQDKGYGFISVDHGSDVFFHITNVSERLPPKVGDQVSFSSRESKKGGRLEAFNVSVIKAAPPNQEQEPARKEKTEYRAELKGFPCIRGSRIDGFRVEREIGHLRGEPEPKWRWFGFGRMYFKWFTSVDEARQALIKEARKRGANAIFDFVWHRNDTYSFWAEGRAVYLVPSD